MNITRFKTLLAIAELGTFAEAAAAVHLTPAAVSQQIKALEEELGVTLFDRSKRPPELNPAGYALVPKARELVRIYEDLKPTLAGHMNTVENLVVGTVPTTMTGLMPKALKALQDSHQNLHVRLYSGLSEDLYAQVDRGFLDAAVISEPLTVYEHLSWRPFAEEPLVVLASSETESDDPKEILESYPYIRFARRAWVGRAIDEWLRDNNVRIRETMELETLEATAAMVLHNLGVSIVPMSCCAVPEQALLRMIPLGKTARPRVLGVISRRDSGKDQLIEILWNELLGVVIRSGRGTPLSDPRR